MNLPDKLLKVIFYYRGYNAPVPDQESLIPVITDTMLSLSPLQQQILTTYYSTKRPLRSLVPELGISFSKINRELHLALHKLRMAANSPYRVAHERVFNAR